MRVVKVVQKYKKFEHLLVHFLSILFNLVCWNDLPIGAVKMPLNLNDIIFEKLK